MKRLAFNQKGKSARNPVLQRLWHRATAVPERQARRVKINAFSARLELRVEAQPTNNRQTIPPSFNLEKQTTVTATALEKWYRFVAKRDISKIATLLSDDVVFHSPIVPVPHRGKEEAALFLSAALKVFFNDTYRYVREIAGTHDAALEFEVEVHGHTVNGIDLIKWNDDGLITEFKVLLRPLKVINFIHENMAEILKDRT